MSIVSVNGGTNSLQAFLHDLLHEESPLECRRQMQEAASGGRGHLTDLMRFMQWRAEQKKKVPMPAAVDDTKEEQRQLTQALLARAPSFCPNDAASAAAATVVMTVGMAVATHGFVPPTLLGLVSPFRAQLDVLKNIGRGGFGTVSLVKSRLDQRLMAIKKIPFKSPLPPWSPSAALEAEQSKMLREVKALVQMGFSPHVVRYYSSWLEPNWEKIGSKLAKKGGMEDGMMGSRGTNGNSSSSHRQASQQYHPNYKAHDPPPVARATSCTIISADSTDASGSDDGSDDGTGSSSGHESDDNTSAVGCSRSEFTPGWTTHKTGRDSESDDPSSAASPSRSLEAEDSMDSHDSAFTFASHSNTSVLIAGALGSASQGQHSNSQGQHHANTSVLIAGALGSASQGQHGNNQSQHHAKTSVLIAGALGSASQGQHGNSQSQHHAKTSDLITVALGSASQGQHSKAQEKQVQATLRDNSSVKFRPASLRSESGSMSESCGADGGGLGSGNGDGSESGSDGVSESSSGSGIGIESGNGSGDDSDDERTSGTDLWLPYSYATTATTAAKTKNMPSIVNTTSATAPHNNKAKIKNMNIIANTTSTTATNKNNAKMKKTDTIGSTFSTSTTASTNGSSSSSSASPHANSRNALALSPFRLAPQQWMFEGSAVQAGSAVSFPQVAAAAAAPASNARSSSPDPGLTSSSSSGQRRRRRHRAGGQGAYGHKPYGTSQGAHRHHKHRWPYFMYISMELISGDTLDVWMKKRTSSALAAPAPHSKGIRGIANELNVKGGSGGMDMLAVGGSFKMDPAQGGSSFSRGRYLCQGGPSRLKRGTVHPSDSLALGEVERDVFVQLVTGVAHCHAAGIIHRDLKPANVFVIPVESLPSAFGCSTDSGLLVKLCDFGLAVDDDRADMGTSPPWWPCSEVPKGVRSSSSVVRFQGAASQRDSSSEAIRQGPSRSSLSATSQHTSGVGTASYAATEQMRGGGQYGPAVDIFPLGIMLMELCCAFTTGMERAMAMKDAREGRLPTDMLSKYPMESKLALQLLSPDPVLRPTALELLAILDVIWGGGAKVSAARRKSSSQTQAHVSPHEEEGSALGDANCISMQNRPAQVLREPFNSDARAPLGHRPSAPKVKIKELGTDEDSMATTSVVVSLAGSHSSCWPARDCTSVLLCPYTSRASACQDADPYSSSCAVMLQGIDDDNAASGRTNVAEVSTGGVDAFDRSSTGLEARSSIGQEDSVGVSEVPSHFLGGVCGTHDLHTINGGLGHADLHTINGGLGHAGGGLSHAGCELHHVRPHKCVGAGGGGGNPSTNSCWTPDRGLLVKYGGQWLDAKELVCLLRARDAEVARLRHGPD